MLNKKLKTIASLIDKNDTVLDIGCDHAYLAIYLKQNNLCKDVYASDINSNALKQANKNIKNANLNIIAYLSDGFRNIENEAINTAVISGMGTNTILDILKYAPSHINKFIISSNNNHAYLRKKLYKNKLYIKKEIVILDNNKYYIIMLVTKDYLKENKISLKYGKANNKDYLKFLKTKEKDILAKIPKTKIYTRLKHQKNLKELTKLIEKS